MNIFYLNELKNNPSLEINKSGHYSTIIGTRRLGFAINSPCRIALSGFLSRWLGFAINIS
jgi:hypothetical protein